MCPASSLSGPRQRPRVFSQDDGSHGRRGRRRLSLLDSAVIAEVRKYQWSTSESPPKLPAPAQRARKGTEHFRVPAESVLTRICSTEGSADTVHAT